MLLFGLFLYKPSVYSHVFDLSCHCFFANDFDHHWYPCMWKFWITSKRTKDETNYLNRHRYCCKTCVWNSSALPVTCLIYIHPVYSQSGRPKITQCRCFAIDCFYFLAIDTDLWEREAGPVPGPCTSYWVQKSRRLLDCAGYGTVQTSRTRLHNTACDLWLLNCTGRPCSPYNLMFEVSVFWLKTALSLVNATYRTTALIVGMA